jgi:hypothetical protein
MLTPRKTLLYWAPLRKIGPTWVFRIFNNKMLKGVRILGLTYLKFS